MMATDAILPYAAVEVSDRQPTQPLVGGARHTSWPKSNAVYTEVVPCYRFSPTSHAFARAFPRSHQVTRDALAAIHPKRGLSCGAHLRRRPPDEQLERSSGGGAADHARRRRDLIKLAKRGAGLHFGSHSRSGPAACPECLVPKELFTVIVTRRLNDVGLQLRIAVVYPAEHLRQHR
jgi:hypothetical protein